MKESCSSESSTNTVNDNKLAAVLKEIVLYGSGTQLVGRNIKVRRIPLQNKKKNNYWYTELFWQFLIVNFMIDT